MTFISLKIFFLKRKSIGARVSFIQKIKGLTHLNSFFGTKSLALEVGKHGILVNSIAPGAVETDMTGNVSEKFLKEYREETPLGRMAKPEEIAKVALFLATDATYITGEVISVNGGNHV